jgi:putative Holliday junction resolvase
MAFPRGSVTVGDPARLVEDLLVLINEEDASCVVIGLPKNLDGREGQSAKDSRRLAEELAKRLSDSDVMVVLHDERLTTVQASQSLHAAGRSSRDQRAVIDSAAATVLLEAWMQCQ